MNSCAFQGILLEKSLRYTQERRAIAEFVVVIDPLREEDPTENLKAIYMEREQGESTQCIASGRSTDFARSTEDKQGDS